MKTQVNGKAADWPARVQQLWDKGADGRPVGRVLKANYFEPRPYVDEYNRGSRDEGFVYTLVIDGKTEVWHTAQVPVD